MSHFTLNINSQWRWLPLLVAGVFTSTSAMALEISDAQQIECRDQISKVTCLSGQWDNIPTAPGNVKVRRANVIGNQERACSPAPKDYVDTLLTTYDKLTPEVKLAFCHIKRIYIVTSDPDFGARVSQYFDVATMHTVKMEDGSQSLWKKPVGFVLEISEFARFTRLETTTDFETRGSQADFGRDTLVSGVSRDLPSVVHTENGKDIPSLQYTLTHEVGHMLANANRIVGGLEEQKSWLTFSWVSDPRYSDYVAFGFEYRNWQQLRNRLADPNNVVEVLATATSAGLPSQYSAVSPAEDFAETFALLNYPERQTYLNGVLLYDWEVEAKENTRLHGKLLFIKSLIDAHADPYDIEHL